METKTEPEPAAPPAQPKPKRRPLRWLVGPAIGAGATIVAALIALLAAPNAGVSIANISIGQQPTHTVTHTVTPPAATVTVTAPAPVEPADPVDQGETAGPTSGPPAGTTLLVKRELVEGDLGNRYTDGAFKIDGTLYPDSFAYELAPCRTDGDQGTTGWDLAGEFETLHAVVGLRGDSNPETEAKYTFIGDGRELRSVIVKWRQHEPLDIDVSGVLRLQVKVAVVAESAGDCRGRAYPAWGQPYLTPSRAG